MTGVTSSIPKPQQTPINPDLLQHYSPKRERLGKGAFGSVFRGRDRETDSPVAIKVQRNTQEARAEAAFHQTLNVCHSVRCRKFFADVEEEDTSRSYIVMDLINEASIPTAFFDPKKPTVRLTFDDIITITRQTLEVLECLAEQDIIYFDLKLSNLIYKKPSRSLTVVDFGAARKINALHHLTLTPICTAPEYGLGAPLTPSFDLWSLGCAVFALLTGRLFLPSIPQAPAKMDAVHLNNITLQLIANRIGKPTAEYLAVCTRTGLFFDEQMEFKNKITLPETKSWIEILRETGQQKGWAQEDIDGVIRILSRMLCYENRATATELLEHSIFKREIAVSFTHDPNIHCKMYIYRESVVPQSAKEADELTLGDFPTPDLYFDLKETTSDCLHIPRDSDRYLVLLEKDGNTLADYYSLEDYDNLDISELQECLNQDLMEKENKVFDKGEEGGEPPTKKPNTQEGD